MQTLKKVVIGLPIAVAAGVVAGALSRAMMRLIAEVAGANPGFSWEGTFFIVMIFVVAAVPVAVLAAFTTRWWRWIAGVAGTALLALPAVSIAGEELGETAGFSAAQWVGAMAATAAIIATTVALPIVTVRLVDRALTRAGLRQPRHTAALMPDLAGSGVA